MSSENDFGEVPYRGLELPGGFGEIISITLLSPESGRSKGQAQVQSSIEYSLCCATMRRRYSTYSSRSRSWLAFVAPIVLGCAKVQLERS